MPLSFLLVLFTYLVIATACLRFNNSLAGGLVNTFTLGIILFAGIVAWSYGRRRPFWLGFFMFFTALHIVDTWRTADLLKWYTLSFAMGELIQSKLSSGEVDLEPIVRRELWYPHVANCFVSTAFGIIGGVVTSKALGRDIGPNQLGTDK
jgi:hypothetical protein